METVVEQISDFVVHQIADNIPALGNIEGKLFGKTALAGDGAFADIPGRVAVMGLERVGDHVILALKKRIKGLSGDAGFFAQLADTDIGIGLFSHQLKQGSRNLLLGGKRRFIFPAIHNSPKKT